LLDEVEDFLGLNDEGDTHEAVDDAVLETRRLRHAEPVVDDNLDQADLHDHYSFHCPVIRHEMRPPPSMAHDGLVVYRSGTVVVDLDGLLISTASETDLQGWSRRRRPTAM